MKQRYLCLTWLMLLICASPGMADDQEKLQASLKTWHQLRKKSEGDYSYTVRWTSFVPGVGHETKVIVRDNKVVERRFRSFDGPPVLVKPGQPATQPKGKTWSEKGKSLGTHKAGAPPKTLDQLYSEAFQNLKLELKEHERRFVRFDKQGLLLSCFTVDTRIADDAPGKGVKITGISLGAAKDKATGKVYKSPGGKAYPAHWGAPPLRQTRDLRPLPGGYGRGSSTLGRWIQKNLDRDARTKKKTD